eukprot:TRINITY_DN874_c0_g1_i2.p2 TRINITY_DN874_c0_g1~~TRINITY_DN874_c0_g1_i2.p2  ORF type:complete len:179 (+),score=18.80 TRINITY_DN874_c0_g1_i2:1213-1749(+)
MKHCSAAGGTSKDPIFLSSVLPCLVKSVADCAKTIPKVKHATQIGKRQRTLFTSSTCSTVQSLQFRVVDLYSPSSSSATVALSRNLISTNNNNNNKKHVKCLSFVFLVCHNKDYISSYICWSPACFFALLGLKNSEKKRTSNKKRLIQLPKPEATAIPPFGFSFGRLRFISRNSFVLF